MEQIAAGIEREHIGQITAYRITKMSVEILNAWSSVIIEVLNNNN